MPKLTWKIVNHTQTDLNITQYVMSLNFTQGRPTPVAPYSGNSASITMKSYGGLETYVSINDEIYMYSTATGASEKLLFVGRVISRVFDDNPGDGVNSTMTVSLNDAMLQAGQANFQNQSLVSVNDQIEEIGVLLPQAIFTQFLNDTNMSTGTFTTNANQRVNEIIAGDRGVVANENGNFLYYPPSQFQNIIDTNFTIGRTVGFPQIAYQDLVRVEAASNSVFYTQATITGTSGTVTKTSTASTTYGVKTFTATTAQNNRVTQTAEWYANTFSDPKTVMLNIRFNDVGQSTTPLQLLNNFFSDTKFVEVRYTPPGGTAITGYFWPEQITFNATVDKTDISMIMSPLTYYNNFTLNSTVFGVLDTSRLGVGEVA